MAANNVVGSAYAQPAHQYSVTRDIAVVILARRRARARRGPLGADDERDHLLDRIRHLTAPSARLLLIDDDSALHTILADELSRLGYTIESAFSGETGIAAAMETKPDVIILDLMMPGMSGFEVAGALKDNPATERDAPRAVRPTTAPAEPVVYLLRAGGRAIKEATQWLPRDASFRCLPASPWELHSPVFSTASSCIRFSSGTT